MSLFSLIWGATHDRNVRFSRSSCVIYSFLSQKDFETVNRKNAGIGCRWGKGIEISFTHVKCLFRKKCTYNVKV